MNSMKKVKLLKRRVLAISMALAMMLSSLVVSQGVITAYAEEPTTEPNDDTGTPGEGDEEQNTTDTIKAEKDTSCPYSPTQIKNGNFEVFVDEQPVKFRYDKTKELLAYLVDRTGALCTNGEIMAVLWSDEKHSEYLRSLKKDLIDTFTVAGCGDVISKQWGKIGIVREIVDCDYYDWLDSKISAVNLYRGEYMTQYSWCEFTNARIIGETR